MKKLLLVTVCILFLIAVLPAEGRYALVMGNSDYEVSPLENPENDARAMEESLESLGFIVTPVYNGSIREMIKALNEFKSNLRPGDTGLFFYAGHGIQVDGLNYLIPVDAALESQEDIEFETLQLDRVVRSMENSGAATSIVILDSCRDNPFKGATRSLSRGLSVVNAARGSLVIYATAPGEVAQDGTGDNGLFTSVLLKYLEEPGLEVNRMLTRIRMEVSDLTGGKQVPYASVSLMSDFYFNTEGLDKSAMATMRTGKFVLPLIPDGVTVTLDGVPYNDQLEQRGEYIVSGSISSGEHVLAFQGDYVPRNTKMAINVKERETVNTDIVFEEYGRLNIILPQKPVNFSLSNPDVELPELSPEMLLPPGIYQLTAAYDNDPVKDTFSEQVIIKSFETVVRDLNGLDYSAAYKVGELEEKRTIIVASTEVLSSKRKVKKSLGWGFLGAGALMGAGSAVSYILGADAYDSYSNAAVSADAVSSRADAELYGTLFVGTLVGSVLGLAAGGFFHITAPDPSYMDEQIRNLDEQIRTLSLETY